MALHTHAHVDASGGGFMARLNGVNHRKALIAFAVIVNLHLLEHVVQALQIWGLGWDRADARGVVGIPFPVLISEEWLHYGYAVIMLVGLWIFRPGFTGASRKWWDIALGIQVWHHFEHLLLFGQALFNANLFGQAHPVSVVQLLVPRVELHLIYNAAVMIPMAVSMALHLFPPPGEDPPACGCSLRSREPEPAGSLTS